MLNRTCLRVGLGIFLVPGCLVFSAWSQEANSRGAEGVRRPDTLVEGQTPSVASEIKTFQGTIAACDPSDLFKRRTIEPSNRAFNIQSYQGKVAGLEVLLPKLYPQAKKFPDQTPSVADTVGQMIEGIIRNSSGLFVMPPALATGSNSSESAAFPRRTSPNDLPGQQPGAVPPKRHTGFKALVYDTASDFKAFPLRRSTWVILGIGGAAALLVHPADDHVTEELSESDGAKDVFAAGKYIGSVPVQAGVAAGLFVVGRYVMHPGPGGSRTNKVSHLGYDLMRGLIVSQTLTQAIKFAAQRDRPNGECCAFPSGHASAAFATASILERHFGYRGAWPTWLIAGYVSASRLADNRHFLSDVMFGAALGVASGWTVVGRHGRSNYTLVPVPIPGGVMISLARRAHSEGQW